MTFADKLKAMFQSRRFYAAVIGLIVMFMSDVLGLDAAESQTVVGIVAAWILGDSISKTGGDETTWSTRTR